MKATPHAQNIHILGISQPFKSTLKLSLIMGPKGRLTQNMKDTDYSNVFVFLSETIGNPLRLHAQGRKVPYFSNVRHC